MGPLEYPTVSIDSSQFVTWTACSQLAVGMPMGRAKEPNSGFSPTRTWPSVNGRQNAPHFRVPKHEVPQPVVVLGARLSKRTLTKRQVAVCVKAGRNAQGVRRQCALKAVFAGDLKDGVRLGCHVEAAIGQRIELPVAAVVLRCQPASHVKHGRLKAHRKIHAE